VLAVINHQPTLAALASEIETKVLGISELVLDDFTKAYPACKTCTEIKIILEDDANNQHHYNRKYELYNGALYLKPGKTGGPHRLLVPNDKKLRGKITSLHHDNLAGGHHDAESTYLRLREKFFFPNMYEFKNTCAIATNVCVTNMIHARARAYYSH